MNVWKMFVLLAALILGLAAPAGAIDLLKVDEAKIRKEVWEPSTAKMPLNYSGTVFLDGKPLPGVLVTDGIHFVRTDAQGRYRIEILFDAMTPLLAARVISARWPDGTWPEKHPVNGRLRFWQRVGDVKDKPNEVDFFLKTRKIEPPFVVAFGADPHENLRDNWNYVMPQEIAAGGNQVHLGMLLGDLTYANLAGAPKDFAFFEKYAREFPVSFLHLFGNHDFVCGPPESDLVGHGAFQKYLNPKRLSFDVAGVHVLVFDYWFLNRQGVDWAIADLSAVPKERPVYVFVHCWGSYLDELCAKFPNIRLVQGGHSHRTQYHGKSNNADFWTFYAYYRTLYIDGDYYEFLDRRRGEHRNPKYHCYDHGLGGGGSRISQVQNLKLVDAARPMPPYPAATEKSPAKPESDKYDLLFVGEATGAKPATRFGMRIVAQNGEVVPFYYDAAKKIVNMAGRVAYFDPVPLPAACLDTKYPQDAVWQAYYAEDAYLKLAPEEQARPEQKAKYADARAKVEQWKRTEEKRYEEWLKANPPSKRIEMAVNVCPQRIQVYVNGIVAYFQFRRVGPPKGIEVFAEGGEATFYDLKSFEVGAGFKARGFDPPPRKAALR